MAIDSKTRDEAAEALLTAITAAVGKYDHPALLEQLANAYAAVASNAKTPRTGGVIY